MAKLKFFLKLGWVQGGSKDPSHKDWIPISSFSFGDGSSPSSLGSGALKVNVTDAHFVAEAEDVNVSSLTAFLVAMKPNLEPAKLDAMPEAVGGEGFQLQFFNPIMSILQQSGSHVSFTLNFSAMERRYLLKFR